MIIRNAQHEDFEAIWPIFQEIVSAGETYGYDPNMDNKQAFHLWIDQPQNTFVIEEDSVLLGTYFIKPNQGGPGSHVCNCGYMVSSQARGKGLATKMCEHSQQVALELGFKAMQFNSVVSTNEGAVRLWQKLEFEIVGTLPKAFRHPTQGYVDAYVMYKWLAE